MKLGLPPWARVNVPVPVGAFLILAGVFTILKLVRPVIPASAILLYMGFVLAGVIIHITLDDGRMRRFRDFFVGSPGERTAVRVQRWGMLAVVPVLLGWWVYGTMRPSYAPPVEIFQRHPTVGEETLSRIQVPEWVAARWSKTDIEDGKALYQGNCAVCHGKNLDGKGPAAEGFRYPIRPANFRDQGTIAQLTLPYVYWRLTTGGIQNQFNSAMPRWVAPSDQPDASSLHTYDMTRDEAWKVILYLYHETRQSPRGMELTALEHAKHEGLGQ